MCRSADIGDVAKMVEIGCAARLYPTGTALVGAPTFFKSRPIITAALGPPPPRSLHIESTHLMKLTNGALSRTRTDSKSDVVGATDSLAATNPTSKPFVSLRAEL
jgi:hypothetical protein